MCIGASEASVLVRLARILVLLTALLVNPRAHGADHEHEVFAPDFVQRLADEQLDPASPEHQKQYRQYTRAFFHGYVDPDGGIYSDDPTFQAGLAAGTDYRRNQPSSLAKVLAVYGYKPIISAGRFSFGLEEMSFVPVGQPSKRWWLTSGLLGGSSVSRFSSCRQGTVTGYLSAPGRYGHLGAYDHELIAQEFHCDS